VGVLKCRSSYKLFADDNDLFTVMTYLYKLFALLGVIAVKRPETYKLNLHQPTSTRQHLNTSAQLMTSSLTRRAFLRTTALAGLAVPASGLLNTPLKAAGGARRREVHIFSKHLQWLDYKNMADFAAECGFDGVDLTVRSGGHVEPANVARDLPLAVRAVQRTGKKVRMITTAIKEDVETHTKAILET